MVDIVSGTEEGACKENIESWSRSFSVLFKLPALSEVELFVFKDKCPPPTSVTRSSYFQMRC